MRNRKQNIINQVRKLCDYIKANERFQGNSIQQNGLKRDYSVLENQEENKDIRVFKKLCFNQTPVNEIGNDPTVHKSNSSIIESDIVNTKHGKIVSLGIIYYN